MAKNPKQNKQTFYMTSLGLNPELIVQANGIHGGIAVAHLFRLLENNHSIPI